MNRVDKYSFENVLWEAKRGADFSMKYTETKKFSNSQIRLLIQGFGTEEEEEEEIRVAFFSKLNTIII